MKILIVDDNTANLMATEYMFLDTGYTLIKAKNGKECFEAVKENNPDLILLDVNLPDINGISICKMLKENAETRNIHIIMMSGLFTDSDNQALGLETGADGYITRPFQKRELHARVSSLLRIKVAEDELRNALQEKKESEEQLKKYKEHLEELVASRTNELEKANQRLKEVNEFQAKFISIVSHEFRTPLTSILGAADLLEMFGSKWDREKFGEYISRIQKSVEYMTELINDLLIIRKADSGNMSAKCSRINLFNLCSETVEIIKSKLEATHSIVLNYNIDKIFLTQDEKLLKMILLNLLSNAVKYSPQGGEIIFGVDLEDSNLLFRIKDHGIGIAEDDMKRLFEPFFRGNNAKKIPGTGLGLSIVKRSVELSGGRILIDSKLNEGTSMTVFIPY